MSDDEIKKWTDAEIIDAVSTMQEYGMVNLSAGERDAVARLCRQIRDHKDARISDLEHWLANAQAMIHGDKDVWENYDRLMLGGIHHD